MGLLNTLGLKPTAAMVGRSGADPKTTQQAPGKVPQKSPGKAPGKAPVEKSPEMKTLVARFEHVMKRIKALEAGKSPKVLVLKLAAIAAGKLSTSPKGIVAANAALDRLEPQIVDAKKSLDDAGGSRAGQSENQMDGNQDDGKKEARNESEPDGKRLASEARERMQSLEARGKEAIAANPRNPNAQWLVGVVKDFGGQIAELEKIGTQRKADAFTKRLDWLEESVAKFEAGAKEEKEKLAGKGGGSKPGSAQDDGSKGAASINDGSLEDGSKDAGSQDEATADGKKRSEDSHRRLQSLDERGRKAIAADKGNTNGEWLKGVVTSFEEQAGELASRDQKAADEFSRKSLDWLEDSVVRFEEDAKRSAAEATKEAAEAAEAAKAGNTSENKKQDLAADGEKKKAKPESPALRKVKAQFRKVMAEVKKLAKAKNPKAEALKKAAEVAGNMATSAKGIEQAQRALDMVMSDTLQATSDAGKTQNMTEQGGADGGKPGPETFDITVGGNKMIGVHRDEAMKALRLERGKLNAQLEGGWAFHVEQMKLPAEVPFQAWLTSGVDAIRSLVKGKDRAKIPDLDIWDPARDMMNQCKAAERKGDVKAFEALLPNIAIEIPKARSRVGSYKDQMEDAAETGVAAGRFVEDSAASAIGTLNEARGGSKIGAQVAAQGVFAAAEQLTEWAIGMRQKPDPGAVAKKVGEELIGAVFKEMIAGKLKPLFKSAFGSYLGKSITDAELKAMDLTRESFMTAGQKWFSDFAPKVLAGLIKSSLGKLINGTMPGSPEAMVDVVAGDLMKGSGKQTIVDGIKSLTKAAADVKSR